MIKKILIISFFVTLGTPAFAVERSEQAVSQVTQEVSEEILSPFCPGKTMAMCTSPAAAEARRTIQGLAKKGLSKEEIKDRLIDQYGKEFRRVTPGQSDNMVVVVLVLLALLLCGVFVWYLTRKKGLNVEEELSGESNEEENEYLEDLRREYKD